MRLHRFSNSSILNLFSRVVFLPSSSSSSSSQVTQFLMMLFGAHGDTTIQPPAIMFLEQRHST